MKMRHIIFVLISSAVLIGVVLIRMQLGGKGLEVHVSRMANTNKMVLDVAFTNTHFGQVYSMDNSVGIWARWTLSNGKILEDNQFLPGRSSIMLIGPGEGSTRTFFPPTNAVSCIVTVEAYGSSRIRYFLRNQSVFDFSLRGFVDPLFKPWKFKRTWEFSAEKGNDP